MKKKTMSTEYNYYISCRDNGAFGTASFACCALMMKEFYEMRERKIINEDRRAIRKHMERFFK